MSPAKPKLKVLKKLGPEDRGAKKLAEKYGVAFVCVRHRTDAKGQFRYTTVELLIERTPIKARVDRMVEVKIEVHERSLHSVVRAAGAIWDGKARLWRMPSKVAEVLNLRDRIVEK